MKKVSVYTLAIENDNDIIREYCSGNTELAATSFVRKYQNFVYSTALRHLQSHDDADDAAQEAFIKALNSLKKFRGDSSIKTWLYRITTNVCINMQRKKKVFSMFLKDSTEDYFKIPSEDVSPHQSVENREFELNFKMILSKLPEKQRETFVLRYYEELPYEEISQMLGTSVGGLKANYYQAVKKLAIFLKNN
jgi:RNA polymerase sigma factor (sigma-70 family)